MKYLATALFMLLLSISAFAQTADPLFETRAVWFATVLRDGGWPVQGASASSQEQALRERIRRAYGLGMNTFIFQAVARGDALYPSTRLPWTEKPLGAGQDPGYDPLAVAIDEAHRLGMELHAWINVFRVGDGNTETIFQNVDNPQHILFAHPEWVGEKDGGFWIDPYEEDARAWLVENVMEIVRNYDVDAVHFDFIRYPQGGLASDGDKFQTDPDNSSFASIGEWRRNNVTEFVRAANAAVLAEKPWVKVGSTPIGNYEDVNGWPALFGYSDVYQASREWLAEGINDYLAPQIYWDIDNTPKFDVLAEQWVDASSGRPIFAGIGAYVDSVQPEVAEQIGITREAGAAGQVFFRYDHLLEVAGEVLEAYAERALPAPMPHRFEAAAPTTPQEVTIAAAGQQGVELAWASASGTASDPVRGYALFRRFGEAPDPNSAEDLLLMVDATETSFSETISSSQEGPIFYSVIAVSKLGLPSNSSVAVSIDSPVAVEAEAPEIFFRLDPAYPNPAHTVATFSYEIRQQTEVSFKVYDMLGRQVATLAEGPHAPGRYQVRLKVAGMPSGVYVGVLQSDNARQTQQFLVTR
ncbi:MAG TPA: family 10 glycosylhydrolase [Rhodothermales bacterium]|nr:family 10 glycosylhydrolase [Rhodothermales bacterium]